jgi:Domain of unknown function (DUF4893)
MPLRSLFLIVGILLSLSACRGNARPEAIKPVVANWRRTITAADNDRLGSWRTAFAAALEKARAAGHGNSISLEGALLIPDAALDSPRPPVGHYRCRVIKLGARASLSLDYLVYPATDCIIEQEDEVLSFVKSGGTQRPVGLLFPEEGNRMVFLGTMVLGDERRPLEYGRDSARDMVGALERIGPKRWRLILPKPRFESMMDVVELVPA